MRSLTTVSYLIRGAVVAFVFMIAAGLPFGPGGLSPDPRTAEATLMTEVKKLLASDASSSDGFGRVAVSGDTAIVASSSSGVSQFKAGAAYIFRRNQGGVNNWGEVKRLTASDAANGAGFGVSVAISGDTALVGAWNPGGMLSGAAYVFQRDQGGTDNWGEVKKLTASDASFGVLFGHSLAISDDTAVIGSFDNAGTGAAYVYGRDEGGTDNWGEVKKLTASDAEAEDIFVFVGVSGDTVIVGAPREDTPAADAGAAYVFGRDEGGPDNWGEVTKLTASDAQAGIFFGTSVAVNGETAVVGAEDLDGLNEGAAYVFERNAGGLDNWGEVAKLTASDGGPGDRFGGAVGVSGVTVVVGASSKDVEVEGEEEDDVNVGAAYVFRRDEGGTGNWGEVGKLTASDGEPNDYFGNSLGVTSNDTAVISASGDDDGGDDAGAAFVFELPKSEEAGDTDGDGCSDQRESGPDETLGGRRNYKNEWDFYDVLGPGGGPPDGVIDLPNDILGVILRFSPQGQPPYDVNFDRGPSSGPNPWNMTAPDGVIDLPNDILGVILQFNHSCQ